MAHRLVTLCVLLAVIAMAGCHAPPLQPDEFDRPELVAIHAAFEDAVRAAHDDPTASWHSGWMGNAWINFRGGSTRGLCYQWQAWVYQHVAPTVVDVGWEAGGVAINVGTPGEHHAVVVFDPQLVSIDHLLESAGDVPAYVLDAWRRGRADIYRLDDWLELPLRVRRPAIIQDLSKTGEPKCEPP